MSRLMFLRVVAVLGLAVLVYAAYAVGLTQAQTAPSGKAAGAVVAEEGRPSLNSCAHPAGRAAVLHRVLPSQGARRLAGCRGRHDRSGLPIGRVLSRPGS